MTYAITAQARTKLGRQAKTELAAGRIPAVVYGRGIEAKPIAVGLSEFSKIFRQAGYSSLIDLTVEKGTPVKVLVKEVQPHPLTMLPVHIDFYQVRMDEELTADIPLKFVGESRAVKEDGGTLVKSLDTLEVRCLPGDLPHEIEVDLSSLVTFEDAIEVGNLKLPKGVKAVTAVGLTVATVARPMTEEELKKLEEGAAPADVTAIKTEAEEKKAADEAKKAEEAAAEGTPPVGGSGGKASAAKPAAGKPAGGKA